MNNPMDHEIRNLYIKILKYGATVRQMVRLPMYYEIIVKYPDLSIVPAQHVFDSVFINHQGNP